MTTKAPESIWRIEFDMFDDPWCLTGYVNDKRPDSFEVICIETIKEKNEYNRKIERFRLWYKFKETL